MGSNAEKVEAGGREAMMEMIRVVSEVVRMWMGLELCGVLSHSNGGEGSRRLRRRLVICQVSAFGL
jgi:hypothetical protein